MWIVMFISRIDGTTVAGIEGPFPDQITALDYADQRDHMLDFDVKAVRLAPARFVPDQSYMDVAA